MQLGQRVGYAKGPRSGWDQYTVTSLEGDGYTVRIAGNGQEFDAPLRDVIDFPDEGGWN